MKEYNLKDNTVGTNLPTQYGALGKIKNFVKGKVLPALTLELTPREWSELEFPMKFVHVLVKLSNTSLSTGVVAE